MFANVGIYALALALASVQYVAALGSQCREPVTSGTAAASSPYWLQSIKHQGIAAFNSDPSNYTVFRNVMDYGAKGDGVTDDTAAINAAISDGNRCGNGCDSSTTQPAVVFFPQGSYVISTPLVLIYYTQLIGDAKVPPTLLAAPNFSGMAIIDADPYTATGQYYVNQNNFFRSVRNFVLDTRQTPSSATTTGIHWQVSQSTSLMNLVFEMTVGSNHQGIWMENGSGGYMGDLIFNGGLYGMWVGNQQFTVRNVTVNNAHTAVFMNWNWGWTFQGTTISNCQVGFDLVTGGLSGSDQTAGAMAIIDSTVSNTPIYVRTSTASDGKLGGSIVISNAVLQNVTTAVGVVGGATVLAGGSKTITAWGQGNVYEGSKTSGTFTQGTITSPTKASSLLESNGKVFGKMHPQYADYDVTQFVSVRTQGATGNGHTDDTAALQKVFDEYSGCKIIFFDAGTYIVTSTLKIPAGTQIVGEAWSVIAGKGSKFNNAFLPEVVVQVGAPLSQGTLEISDIIFQTIGPTAGAIVVEWNVREQVQGGAGMWDSHIRLGGTAGTNLQVAQCPSGSNSPSTCSAAYLGFHLTLGSTAYLEGMWVWNADHDFDTPGSAQLTIFSARGILSESTGPVWMIGTAEHHTLYQYNLALASNHYIGLAQTETPYYQPVPAAPSPWIPNILLADPLTFPNGSAWAFVSTLSTDILLFGAGFYSFYQNYGQDCITTNTCQPEIISIDSLSKVQIYSLSTLGSTYQVNKGIAAANNVDGYTETATVWTQ